MFFGGCLDSISTTVSTLVLCASSLRHGSFHQTRQHKEAVCAPGTVKLSTPYLGSAQDLSHTDWPWFTLASGSTISTQLNCSSVRYLCAEGHFFTRQTRGHTTTGQLVPPRCQSMVQSVPLLHTIILNSLAIKHPGLTTSS
jgi:hypothetical protein